MFCTPMFNKQLIVSSAPFISSAFEGKIVASNVAMVYLKRAKLIDARNIYFSVSSSKHETNKTTLFWCRRIYTD